VLRVTDPATQAAYIVRTFAARQRAGVVRTLWYGFMKPPQASEPFAIGDLDNNNGTGRLGWLERGSGIGSDRNPELYQGVRQASGPSALPVNVSQPAPEPCSLGARPRLWAVAGAGRSCYPCYASGPARSGQRSSASDRREFPVVWRPGSPHPGGGLRRTRPPGVPGLAGSLPQACRCCGSKRS